MEVNFWRRQSKRAGMSTIYCRITVKGEQLDITSTGVTITTDHWHGKRVSADEPQAPLLNERLVIIEEQLLSIYNNLIRNKELVTAGRIKRLFLEEKNRISLASAFEAYLKDSAIDPDRKLQKSSVTVYDNVRKKVINFLIAHQALDLLVDEFDREWLLKFRRWMKTVPLKGGKIGHADSYIAKQSQTIRDVIVWCVERKLVENNPLGKVRIPQAEYADPVYLTEDQFKRLRKHRFKNDALQRTADVFILLCRCGFHYGDLEDFVKSHRTALKKGLDGKPWMIKDRIKTKVSIRVPVFAEVKAIVDKYGGWEQLPVPSDQKFNGYLKVIAAELGLPEDLSSKAGRKTFTDWCFNTLLLSTDAVVVLLGRKSSKGLEVYGRPDERRVIAELSESKALKKRK